MNQTRQIEWIATVQILIEELESLQEYAKSAVDEGWVDVTQLMRRLPIINALFDEAGVGNIQMVDCRIDENDVTEGMTTAARGDSAECASRKTAENNAAGEAEEGTKAINAPASAVSERSGDKDAREARELVLGVRKLNFVRVSDIAEVNNHGGGSFELTLLLPYGGVVLMPEWQFNIAVRPPECPKVEVVVNNQYEALFLHDSIASFVAFWKWYLKDVPQALSYCGPSGLQILSHEETAQALRLSSEQMTELIALARKKLSPDKAHSLMKMRDCPWFTDFPIFFPVPAGTIGQESFYDPIEVARFSAEWIDPLTALDSEIVEADTDIDLA